MTAVPDTATVSFAIIRLTPVCKGKLAALADVEVIHDGVSMTICGIQVIAGSNGTKITLPTYRDASGQWRPAIRMPPELHDAMGDTVLEAALELGVVKRKSETL